MGFLGINKGCNDEKCGCEYRGPLGVLLWRDAAAQKCHDEHREDQHEINEEGHSDRVEIRSDGRTDRVDIRADAGATLGQVVNNGVDAAGSFLNNALGIAGKLACGMSIPGIGTLGGDPASCGDGAPVDLTLPILGGLALGLGGLYLVSKRK